MRAYTIVGHNFASCFQGFFACEKSILKQNLVLPIEKFLSLVLLRNARMLSNFHYINYKWSLMGG